MDACQIIGLILGILVLGAFLRWRRSILDDPQGFQLTMMFFCAFAGCVLEVANILEENGAGFGIAIAGIAFFFFYGFFAMLESR